MWPPLANQQALCWHHMLFVCFSCFVRSHFSFLSISFLCSEPMVVDVSPYRRRSSPCHPGDRSQQRLGLARSQSDMLPPATLTPPLLGTPVRVNPFSLRQDLNGGRCKLLDTPSKSVISLTFTLPALRDPCASPLLRGTQRIRVPHRRCQSLPCTPELGPDCSLDKRCWGEGGGRSRRHQIGGKYRRSGGGQPE